MNSVLFAPRQYFFNSIRSGLLALFLSVVVVATLALHASESNQCAHENLLNSPAAAECLDSGAVFNITIYAEALPL
jgi:hypothetical protein